jgi:hypothetical protein
VKVDSKLGGQWKEKENVATPLWAKCEGEAHTPKSWELGVLRDSQKFRAQVEGPKHLAVGCSWCHWKGLEI